MAATQKTSTPIRVLVAEFLLASASAADGVAPSMRMEAEAMLTAILTDIAGLPNVQTTVLLSDDSAARLAVSDTKSSKLFDNVRILRSELSPQSLSNLLDSVSPHAAFDAVFLIAPECDGVLVSLLKVVQSQRRSLIRSFNLDWQLAEIFADKRQTAAWLQYHGIPTIPTRTIHDSTAEAFRVAAQLDQAQNVNRIFVRPSFDPEPVAPANPRSRAPALERTARRLLPPELESSKLAVLKPRDGAGAEGVQIVPLTEDFEALPQQCSDDDRWLLQPYMPGLACSVGFIGGGAHSSTTILPPARQQILATKGRLTYHGGQVPCESTIADRIARVAQKFAAALGRFDGYVGADLLVNLAVPENAPASVLIVEINPRLCTSYVGYRALAEDNLAEWLFQQNHERSIRWTSQIVTFSASGRIAPHKSPESE